MARLAEQNLETTKAMTIAELKLEEAKQQTDRSREKTKRALLRAQTQREQIQAQSKQLLARSTTTGEKVSAPSKRKWEADNEKNDDVRDQENELRGSSMGGSGLNTDRRRSQRAA